MLASLSAAEFVNSVLDTFSVGGEVWTQGKQYQTGDIVYGTVTDIVSATQY